LTISGGANPIKNSCELEWQVRPGQDPELFREHREPAWPNKCVFPSEDKNSATQHRKLLASIDIEAASAACAKHTEVDSPDFDLCVLDVLAFCDVDAAAGLVGFQLLHCLAVCLEEFERRGTIR